MTLTLTRPDDCHLHLRDGALLAAVAPHAAACFGRAVVMPNLRPPLTTVDDCLAYRQRILAAVDPGTGFEPLIALYLTDGTDPGEVERAADTPGIAAVKWYPAGATTHSEHGVTDPARIAEVLAVMERRGLPLLIHGEATDPDVDVFDREAVFLERTLAPVLERFPELRIVLEHVTTAEGVAFVRRGPPGLAATITPHHLLLNRNALFQGGLRPHHFCLPVLKRERHREALLDAATSGEARFFLGTDSAPHPRTDKESACGCAGIYTGHAALPLYAEAFEAAGALDRLEGFAASHGPAFYGWPRNSERITLERDPWTVPASYSAGDDAIVPFRAGTTIPWRLAP